MLAKYNKHRNLFRMSSRRTLRGLSGATPLGQVVWCDFRQGWSTFFTAIIESLFSSGLLCECQAGTHYTAKTIRSFRL